MWCIVVNLRDVGFQSLRLYQPLYSLSLVSESHEGDASIVGEVHDSELIVPSDKLWDPNPDNI